MDAQNALNDYFAMGGLTNTATKASQLQRHISGRLSPGLPGVGGGGASATSANAGTDGYRGSGGGGGGGSVNGVAAGAGGRGGNGYACIVAYFWGYIMRWAIINTNTNTVDNIIIWDGCGELYPYQSNELVSLGAAVS